MSRFHITFPIATAMRQAMRGYRSADFRRDAMAGFIVSLLALPLAMALSISVGLPPQHGIYTAVVAGIATALLGGSMTQVSGPTAAFVVIVAPIVSQFGLDGLLWCTLMAGAMLLVMGSVGLGRYINYIPYPVTTGFTAGIAVVIATLALNDFFGLGISKLGDSYLDKITAIGSHMPALQASELLVGMTTLLLIFNFGKVTRKVPATIVGIAAGMLMAYGLNAQGFDIATIGTRFSYVTADGLVQGIPPYLPHVALPDLPAASQWRELVWAAMVIAALAALESLLSATVADNMSGTKHHPGAELNGIGIGNILSGLAGGIPATGAIARTAMNIHSGAKTPVASVVHAVLIMLYVLLLSPLIKHIPMASLAALLLVTAWRMSHLKQCVRTLRIAPMSDRLVLLVCFGLTVFVDMVAGVAVGIVLASLLFMRRISELTEFDLSPLHVASQQNHDSALPDHVMIYRMDGPLFFGTVEKAFERYRFMHDHVDTLIVDMEHVPLIDMTGLVAMKAMLTGIAREGRQVYLCGKPDVTMRIVQKVSGQPLALQIHTMATVQEAIACI